MQDEFGDRMKAYERTGTDSVVGRGFPLCVRIDGKGFSRYTSGFTKPFDRRITDAMDATTRSLVEQTHATIAYVQSDEITLIYVAGETQDEHLFGGKSSKVNSILASMATAAFNEVRPAGRPAIFDCRAWAVPDLIEASNVLLWRFMDCRRNSISACYRWIAHRKRSLTQPEMLAHLRAECGFEWESLPDRERFGAFFRRETRERELDDAAWARIPEKHRPASRTVLRSEIVSLPVGDFALWPLEDRVALVRPAAPPDRERG